MGSRREEFCRYHCAKGSCLSERSRERGRHLNIHIFRSRARRDLINLETVNAFPRRTMHSINNEAFNGSQPTIDRNSKPISLNRCPDSRETKPIQGKCRKIKWKKRERERERETVQTREYNRIKGCSIPIVRQTTPFTIYINKRTETKNKETKAEQKQSTSVYATNFAREKVWRKKKRKKDWSIGSKGLQGVAFVFFSLGSENEPAIYHLR